MKYRAMGYDEHRAQLERTNRAQVERIAALEKRLVDLQASWDGANVLAAKMGTRLALVRDALGCDPCADLVQATREFVDNYWRLKRAADAAGVTIPKTYKERMNL
jgi:hypothetical protein